MYLYFFKLCKTHKMNTKYPKGDQASGDFGAFEVIVDIFFFN